VQESGVNLFVRGSRGGRVVAKVSWTDAMANALDYCSEMTIGEGNAKVGSADEIAEVFGRPGTVAP